MNTPANAQHPTRPSDRALAFPRPDTSDPMVAATRTANIGARLELAREQALSASPERRSLSLERISAVESVLADIRVAVSDLGYAVGRLDAWIADVENQVHALTDRRAA